MKNMNGFVHKETYELFTYKEVLMCECQRFLYKTPRHLLETCIH